MAARRSLLLSNLLIITASALLSRASSVFDQSLRVPIKLIMIETAGLSRYAAGLLFQLFTISAKKSVHRRSHGVCTYRTDHKYNIRNNGSNRQSDYGCVRICRRSFGWCFRTENRRTQPCRYDCTSVQLSGNCIRNGQAPEKNMKQSESVNCRLALFINAIKMLYPISA